MPSPSVPGLYGLGDGNSSRQGKDLWGKNQFNSTFPLALCLKMRDDGVAPVAVALHADGKVAADPSRRWSMEEVIGDKRDNPYYHFEKTFSAYESLSRNEVEKIDLVVSLGGEDWRPLEVKLTVVPDSGTARKSMNEWGPELVLRPVSSAYAMMGLASSLSEDGNAALKADVMSIIRPNYNAIQDWTNIVEISSNRERLRDTLSGVLDKTLQIQKPFLIQPIWRTEGQAPVLATQCFDLFVWSDAAVMRLPIDLSHEATPNRVTRHLREVARHVRALYDILNSGDFDYRETYKGMPLGNQTDKAFAMAGSLTREYLNHPCLTKPRHSRDILDSLILNGGGKELKPERRFDAAVVAYLTSNRHP